MSKVRVGAYCRVSTEKDDQLNSLENQKKYFEEYIQRHENWEFVNIYPDEQRLMYLSCFPKEPSFYSTWR